MNRSTQNPVSSKKIKTTKINSKTHDTSTTVQGKKPIKQRNRKVKLVIPAEAGPLPIQVNPPDKYLIYTPEPPLITPDQPQIIIPQPKPLPIIQSIPSIPLPSPPAQQQFFLFQSNPELIRFDSIPPLRSTSSEWIQNKIAHNLIPV